MIDIFQYVTLEQLAFAGIALSIIGVTAGIIISTQSTNSHPVEDDNSAESKNENKS